jgi:putative lipoic acid-binding regulatory protein
MDKVLKVGYEKGKIVKVVRFGKFDEKKLRPLLVEFSNAHVKNVVMENVTKLGSAKGEFEGVTISYDMTIKEREQCRELVEEAKKKQDEEQENYIYRVRGLPGQMKIVRYRKA